VDLGAVATGVIKKLSAASARHRLVANIPGDLPEVSVDRVRAERVLHNLVENAIKYSPGGGNITLSAREDNGQIIVSVEDQGIGLTAQEQAQLFQPFGRLEATRLSRDPRDARDGLGLGLSIVTAIAAAHDADLRARPRSGGGLEVEVQFPPLPAAAAPPAEAVGALATG